VQGGEYADQLFELPAQLGVLTALQRRIGLGCGRGGLPGRQRFGAGGAGGEQGGAKRQAAEVRHVVRIWRSGGKV
jgi:hypothetical protein